MFVTSDTLVKIDTICDCIGIFIFSFWEEGNLEGDFGEGDWNGGTPSLPTTAAHSILQESSCC